MNNEALPESKELLNFLLTNAQKEIVGRAIKEIKENPDSYDIDFFWELDASIGGIGGYCMPFDPTRNPFPTGIGRDLFRPLQYAAGAIKKDAYFLAKYTVQQSGLHLEKAAKYVLQRVSIIENVKTKVTTLTLGKLVEKLKEQDIVQQNLTEPLKIFNELYKKSKHDVNQDEERERLFSISDALISYISARILGKALLRPYYPEILKSIEKYFGRLKGLNMNL